MPIFDLRVLNMCATIFPETVRFKAPEGLLAALRDAAQREGVTVSEFVRGAIRERLRGAGDPENGDGD